MFRAAAVAACLASVLASPGPVAGQERRLEVGVALSYGMPRLGVGVLARVFADERVALTCRVSTAFILMGYGCSLDVYPLAETDAYVSMGVIDGLAWSLETPAIPLTGRPFDARTAHETGTDFDLSGLEVGIGLDVERWGERGNVALGVRWPGGSAGFWLDTASIH